MIYKTPHSLLAQLKEASRPDAWDRFVKLYTPLLYYWVRRLGLRDHDAEDLVQDVFALLVRKLAEFDYDRDKSFRSWLHTILLNKWRDRRRRLASRPGEVGEEALADLATPNLEDPLGETEYRQGLLARALDLLQEEFQPSTWKAFQQHGLAGHPAAEVAAELGLSTGAVYSAKFRVLARLREYLSGLLDEPPE